ncbi:MAG: hypothetical protein PWR29_837 [Methanolobus sp.]|jgi:hypothetical protein|nr:hypothetical protein [Methanolobus sp.]MDK2911880.1 hypothetical protein [Methanolobus sp.]MDN5310563.1 hypothetical protein [Methanolobus sp.]
MSNSSKINADSWELALLAVLNNRGSIQAYSTAQVRKIIASALSEDNIAEIQRLKVGYNPAPPQGKKPDQARFEIKAKRDKNEIFATHILQTLGKYDRHDLQQLMQYTLWNIKLLEDKKAVKNAVSYAQRLELLFECEGIDKKSAMSKINPLLESGQSPRNNDRKDTRGPQKNYRRY